MSEFDDPQDAKRDLDRQTFRYEVWEDELGRDRLVAVYDTEAEAVARAGCIDGAWTFCRPCFKSVFAHESEEPELDDKGGDPYESL